MDSENIYKTLIKEIEAHYEAHKELKETTNWLINSWDVFRTKLSEIEKWIATNRPNFEAFKVDLENIKNTFDELKDKAIDIVDKLIEDFSKGMK